jgi:glycerol-3-phosphate dehydrogenase (NAD(P)+)
MKKEQVAILGGGAWGTAVATVLAENNHNVKLWCHESEVANEIQTKHTNLHFLPGIVLSTNISAYTQLENVIPGSKWIFEAIPIPFLRRVLLNAKKYVTLETSWVILSKGLEQETLLLPTQIIDDVMGFQVKKVVMSGPSFAQEVAKKEFTGVAAAAHDDELLHEAKNLLSTKYFHITASHDIIGIQAGGALKNVCALASGIAKGKGCKSNTTAYLLTQVLQEIATMSKFLGGRRETIYGLSGIGDLFLSCTGDLGKNLRAGKLIAEGCTEEKLLVHFAAAPEGINTIQSVKQLIEKHNLFLPFCSGIYEFIFEGAPFSRLLGVEKQQ